MKKSLYLIGAIMMLITTTSALALEFTPECTYETVPTFWLLQESFDSANIQNYCQYDTETLYIEQEVRTNLLGQYFTSINADLWTDIHYVTIGGNVRDVEITFDYYMPSLNGQCLGNSINPATGLYNSPQSILLTNDQSDLSEGPNFNAAFYDFNNEIVCDQWMTFAHTVGEFENDWGSSFSGRSKSIGAIGFEAKNIYLKNVKIDGTGGTFWMW